MEIKTTTESERLTISVSGRVDTVTAPEREANLRFGDVKCAVIDLTNVPYMSSAGLRLLLTAHKTMMAKGGELQIDDKSKTAKLTISVDYLLRPSFNMDGGGTPQADESDIFGKAGFKVEINIAGLGSGNPTISSVSLGQEIKTVS